MSQGYFRSGILGDVGTQQACGSSPPEFLKHRNVYKAGLTPANSVGVKKVLISMHYHSACNSLVSVFTKADSFNAPSQVQGQGRGRIS